MQIQVGINDKRWNEWQQDNVIYRGYTDNDIDELKTK
jgi:hypothetical protein